jgi:hypothetical protein
VRLCRGNHDQARSLWKVVVQELGYMPLAAAVTLIRASKADELEPDVEAPEVT